MTGGQIAALTFAILLLFPGGCFLVFGIGFSSDPGGVAGLGGTMLLVAAIILSLVAWLFRVAFRRRAGSATEVPPGPPPQL